MRFLRGTGRTDPGDYAPRIADLSRGKPCPESHAVQLAAGRRLHQLIDKPARSTVDLRHQRQRPQGPTGGAQHARGVERREDDGLGRVGRVLQDAARAVAVALAGLVARGGGALVGVVRRFEVLGKD
jgi:hypothetical protein